MKEKEKIKKEFEEYKSQYPAINVPYFVKEELSHKAKQAGALMEKTMLVVDRHSAYRALAEKLGFLLQLCWSHILQDSKELARDFGKEGRYIHRKLKEIYTMACSLNNKGTEGIAVVYYSNIEV